jgi:hypothetical protein
VKRQKTEQDDVYLYMRTHLYFFAKRRYRMDAKFHLVATPSENLPDPLDNSTFLKSVAGEVQSWLTQAQTP